MRKRILAFVSAAVLFTTLTACGNMEKSVSNSPKTLNEIRAEAEKQIELDARYENLDLSQTVFFVPNVDKINNFSLVPVALSVEEREAKLLEVAEIIGGEKTDIKNIVYTTLELEQIPYSTAKNDTKRGEYYFVKYLTDELDAGINIGGNYIYARKKEIARIAGGENEDYWVDRTGNPAKTYNLRKSMPEATVSLLNGEQKISEIAELMTNRLSEMPFFRIDGLNLCADEAQIYSLGEKSAVNISFFYEYKGVPIDNYFRGYGMNIETGVYDSLRTSLKCEASAAWTNSIDELYGAHLYTVEETQTSSDRFIGLETFLAMISDKLTGNSKFKVDSVEFVYGVERVLPEGFYKTPDAKPFEYTPIRFDAKPVWIAYIAKSGIAETPHIRIVMDAVSGELELLK